MKYLKLLKDDIKKSFTISNFKKSTKLFFLPISNLIKLHNFVTSSKFEKVMKVIDSVEDIKVNENNDVMIEFKNSFVLKTEGHQIYYTKDGTIITSALWTSENPIYDMEHNLNNIRINNIVKLDYDISFMNKKDFSRFTFRVKD